MGRTVRVAATLTILALLGLRLGSGPFVAALRAVDPRSVVLALAIGAAGTALSAWRWVLVARRLGVTLPFGDAVAGYYRALFLNAVLPGGVLGDVHRAVRHGRDLGDTPRAARAVVLERLAGTAALAAVTGLVLALGPTTATPVAAGAVATTGVTAAVAVAVAVAVAAAGTALLVPVVRRWAPVALVSVAIVATYLATFLVAVRAAGVTAPLGRVVPLLLLALLAMALPLNVGGWGPREAATAAGFAGAGLDAAQGLTAAVVYGLLVLVAALPGAAVLVPRPRWLRPPLRPRRPGRLVPQPANR